MKLKLALLLLLINAHATQMKRPPHALYYRLGAAADKSTHPQAGYALMGVVPTSTRHSAGSAIALMAERSARVARLSDDAYNSYINGLSRLNSVATIVIPDRQAALERLVANKIREAAAIFISGGTKPSTSVTGAELPSKRPCVTP